MQVYSSESEIVPLIRTDRGTWANHHRLPNGNIGERVEPGEATHFSQWAFKVWTKE